MPGDGGAERYLLLQAGGLRCLVPVRRVRRVVPRVPARPIPGAAPEVAGVGEVEGEPVAILQLARLLGRDPDPRPQRPVTVVLAGKGETEGLALEADEALRLVEVPEEAVAGRRGEGVTGTAMLEDGAAVVVDVDALLEEGSP